jgi:hypothetical protein
MIMQIMYITRIIAITNEWYCFDSLLFLQLSLTMILESFQEDAQQPPRSLTPPTPPVHAQPSPSPPRPISQRAVAQLRPVSIPNIVRWAAGGSMEDTTPLITKKSGMEKQED